MSVKLRKHIERKIARRLVLDAIRSGYEINIDNGGLEEELKTPSKNLKEILDAMFATDDEHLIFYKDGEYKGWVHLIYGEYGWDVIADYTTNLDHLMEGADKISDLYQDPLYAVNCITGEHIKI